MRSGSADAVFVRRAIIVFALAVGLVIAWRLRQVELLLFGAILFAILLNAGADMLRRWLPLSAVWALALSTLIIVAIFLGLLAFFGLRIEPQIADLVRRIPVAWERLQTELAASPTGRAIEAAVKKLAASPDFRSVVKLKSVASQVGVAVAGFLLMAVAGIYLAAEPRAYRGGALRLIPDGRRERFGEFLATSVWLLRRWILAQIAAMVIIGVLSGLGLLALGVPAPAALGVIAGLAEFIPMIGPIIASLPALLIALSAGWQMVAWTALLFIAIHQFESNVLQPLLQRGLAFLPPVLNLFALVAFFAFFGLLGLVFAAPLCIACLAAVRILYLGDEVLPEKSSPRLPPSFAGDVRALRLRLLRCLGSRVRRALRGCLRALARRRPARPPSARR
ncbi:MAG: AI-2E family transporter [Caulobacteraceae bacterium]